MGVSFGKCSPEATVSVAAISMLAQQTGCRSLQKPNTLQRSHGQLLGFPNKTGIDGDTKTDSAGTTHHTVLALQG